MPAGDRCTSPSRRKAIAHRFRHRRHPSPKARASGIAGRILPPAPGLPEAAEMHDGRRIARIGFAPRGKGGRLPLARPLRHPPRPRSFAAAQPADLPDHPAPSHRAGRCRHPRPHRVRAGRDVQTPTRPAQPGARPARIHHDRPLRPSAGHGQFLYRPFRVTGLP